MKTNKPFFLVTVILLAAYLLSACGGAPQSAEGSPDEQAAIKVRASEVAFTGVIEGINGAEWTVNGQLLSVAPEVVSDGPFQVGDTIKIEGSVNQDGSITVLSVEAPSPSDLTDLPELGDDDASDNSNDGNDNDDDSNDNDVNGNDDDGNDNDDDGNDDNGNDNGNDNDDDGNDNDDDSNDNDDDGNDNDNDDDGNDNDDDSNDNDDDDDDDSNDNDDDSNDNDDDD